MKKLLTLTLLVCTSLSTQAFFFSKAEVIRNTLPETVESKACALYIPSNISLSKSEIKRLGKKHWNLISQRPSVMDDNFEYHSLRQAGISIRTINGKSRMSVSYALDISFGETSVETGDMISLSAKGSNKTSKIQKQLTKEFPTCLN